MTVFTAHPLKWSSLAIIFVVGYVIDECTVFGLEGEADLQQQQQPSNRVLPVDAEHKNKISIPQLRPICVQNLKENLVKFLKRVKKDGGVRKGRQDDGDDDGDGEEGLAGVLAGLGEGNGALSVLQAFPAAVPSLVQGFTQLTGSINQGLNGTDTPNLPSFLVKQGMEAIKFFQSISGGGSSSRLPDSSHGQRIPSGPAPNRKPRPPSPGYEQYPGSAPGGGNLEIDPDDYIDEDVKQPLQPTLRPLRPGYGGNDAGLGIRPDYEPIPGGNPFKNKGSGSDGANVETLNGLPPKTSLWQIYKSFRNKSPENGTLSEFQLAHPDAFSNELLQSISQSISSIRGQTANQPVSTDKPASEIFKQIYPENKNPPVVFNNPNRPTLSVYKPSATSGGIGIDLSNLAINASLNALEGHKLSASSSITEDEDDTTPSQSIQGEIEDSSILGLGNKETIDQKATAVKQETTQNTGTFAQLQQQAQMQAVKDNSGGPQFVKSPTSNLLTLQMGEYIPAVSSLHEGEDDLKVGPQTNHEDYINGIRNKAPYQAEKGVFIAAPRLTPSPLYTPKPTSGLFIKEAIETTTLTPDFSYEFLASNSRLGPNSNYPPDASHARPKDPNAPRPPTLIAAIAPNFPSIDNALPQNQNKLDTDRLPSSLLPQVSHVPDSDVVPKVVSTTTEAAYNEVEEVEQETTTPEPPPTSVEEDLSPPEQTKQTAPGTGSLKTSVLASSLSNFAQLSPINQNEQSVDEVPSSEPPPVSVVTQPTTTSNHNSKLFQHLLGSLNLPQLLQHPAVLQSLFATQNNGIALNGTKPSASSTFSTSPEPPTPEEEIQEDIVTSTFSSTLQEELPNPPEQNTNPTKNQYDHFPSGSYLLGGNKGGNPFPSFGAPSNTGNVQPPSQSISDAFEFSNILQSSGSNAQPTNAPPKENVIPPFSYQLNQNAPPFQFEHLYNSNSRRNGTNNVLPTTTTTAAPLNVANQGSFVDNSFYAGINFAPPPRFPNPGSVDPFLVATSTQPPLSLSPGNNWGTQLGPNNNDPYASAPFIAGYPAIAAASSLSNSQKGEPDLATLPPFSGPIGFVPDHKDENDAKRPSSTSSTFITEASTTTEREINLSELSLGFQPSFPDSIPNAPQGGASSGNGNINGSPFLLPSNSQTGPVFQGTFQNQGYPSYVPITSSDIHKDQLIYGGAFASQTENVQGNSEAFTTEESSVKATSASASTILTGSSFSDKLSSHHIGTSAIAEMSKLPYFQEDSFRPSALPPYFIGHGTAKEDQDYEQTEPETEKSVFQLFSSISNSSGTTEVASVSSNSVSTSTVATDSSVTLENDSVEQPYPDFPPGKPVFWMNMYYPNGIPVLMKVTTTSTSTTMKPKKRRRSTTTTEATTTGAPESEYYEDDDDGKKLKKKKKVDVDFVS